MTQLLGSDEEFLGKQKEVVDIEVNYWAPITPTPRVRSNGSIELEDDSQLDYWSIDDFDNKTSIQPSPPTDDDPLHPPPAEEEGTKIAHSVAQFVFFALSALIAICSVSFTCYELYEIFILKSLTNNNPLPNAVSTAVVRYDVDGDQVSSYSSNDFCRIHFENETIALKNRRNSAEKRLMMHRLPYSILSAPAVSSLALEKEDERKQFYYSFPAHFERLV